MFKSRDQQGEFTINLDQESTEFVFNNGHNDWDGPWHAENYVVERPGEYLVRSGQVSVARL